MKCAQAKKRIGDLVAAEERAIPQELLRHMEECGDCAGFYRTEEELLEAMDAGLRSMGKVEVPGSLVARVRQGVEELRERRRGGVNVWVALGTALAGLVLAMVVLWPRVHRNADGGAKEAREIAPMEEVVSRPAEGRATRGSSPEVRSEIRRSRQDTGRPPAEEILVGPDEATGLKALQAEVYRKPAIGAAMLHPTPQQVMQVKTIEPEAIEALATSDLEIAPVVTKDQGIEDLRSSDER